MRQNKALTYLTQPQQDSQWQPHQQDINNENRARTTIFVYKPIASNF
jgi:hypothetical protein